MDMIKTENIAISKLEKNTGQISGLPKNPRFIRDERFELLKKSIQESPEMLNLRELIVYPNGDKFVIVAGNMRFSALRDLGYKEAPCKILPENTTVEKLKEYTIKDNAGFGQNDFDALANEWDMSQLLDWGVELPEVDQIEDSISDGLTDDDDIPEPPSTPTTKIGDVWLLGDHRLMCGDSTSVDDVEKLMNGDLADMVFTDPPYNVNISGLGSGSYKNSIGKIHGEFKMASGEMSKKEFIEFLQSAFNCLVLNSKNGSIHYICMDWKHIVEITSAAACYSEFKNLIVWNKDNGGMGTFYRNKHELIFVYKNGTEKHKNNFGLGETGRYRTNVWDYPCVSSFANQSRDGSKVTGSNETKLHPTVKPLALVADAILDCSDRGDIILDLFGGSGTTLIAAQKTDRKAFLMELDEKYCDVIIKRWQDSTGKEAVLDSSGQKFNELTSVQAA